MAKKSFKKNANLFRGEANPFNVKVNRRKHVILNSKERGTKGLPNVSRGISHAKRKELLQKSKIASQKSNRYFDKRISDPSVPIEDQVTARFVRERQNKVKRNIFNLNDEEELTHKGQPLSKLKSFDKGGINSDDEENLDVSFVSKAHFGGFASESNFESPKSHKELIEQLIMESKQKKMERKIEKEKYINTQEQVDKEWKEIHFINSSKVSNSVKTTISKSEVKDVYDVSKSELKFEPKSSSIIHTKSPEEVAKEEQAKKLKLEQERHARMCDDKELNSSKTDNHLSADGIYDYFDYLQPVAVEDTPEEDPLQQNDGSDSDSDESLESSDAIEDYEFNEKNPDSSLIQNIDKEPSLPDVTSDIPQNIESFRILVKESSAEEVHEIINKILKPIIRSKNEKTLNKLQKFFSVLLQYALVCCEKKNCSQDHISVLIPHLHSLAAAVPMGSAETFLEILDQEQQIFQECKKQNMKADFPRLQTLVILKYAGKIYSVSDFRHPTITPSILFICDILSSKFYESYDNILSRLIINEILLDCIVDSKRFVPEAIIFLNHILYLAVPGKKGKQRKTFNLCLNKELVSEDIPELDLFLSDNSISDENKIIGIIATVFNQLHQFAFLYNNLQSFSEIFSPSLSICSQIPLQFYPSFVQNQIATFTKVVKKNVVLRHLVFQNAKPKPLKMFEPSFESKFDKQDEIKRKRMLLKRVSQKIRKEEKSMIREIRRDAQVVASEKLKEKLEADAERKRKVKEIYGELAMQEGEFKKMMKKKS